VQLSQLRLARPRRQGRRGLEIGVASDASGTRWVCDPPVQLSQPGLARPRRQSRRGLQIGVASDASAPDGCETHLCDPAVAVGGAARRTQPPPRDEPKQDFRARG